MTFASVLAVTVAAAAVLVVQERGGTTPPSTRLVDLASSRPGGSRSGEPQAGDSQSGGYQVGVGFTPRSPVRLTGILYFESGAGDGVRSTSLWSGDRRLVTTAPSDGSTTEGWHVARLPRPVDLRVGSTFVVSQLSDSVPVLDRRLLGRAPAANLDKLRLKGALIGRGDAWPGERIRWASGYPVLPAVSANPTPTTSPSTPTTPAPTPTGGGSGGGRGDGPPSTQGFPDASNTGVPAGTRLSRYSGPCTITRAGTVIDSQQIDCDGALLVKAAGVVIRKSKVNGTVDSDSNTPSASVTIEDSEVDGMTAAGPTISSHDVTVVRSNVHGGMHNVQCNSRCTVRDSFLHGAYVAPNSDWHINAFISNGGSNMTLVHNTLQCEAPVNNADGGCTANLSIFGDFEGNANYTIDHNLFVASKGLSYCAYGGNDPGKKYGEQVSNIRFTNNVFQRGSNGKCGLYGPVTSFNSSKPGMVWTNNVWDDGKPVQPS